MHPVGSREVKQFVFWRAIQIHISKTVTCEKDDFNSLGIWWVVSFFDNGISATISGLYDGAYGFSYGIYLFYHEFHYFYDDTTMFFYTMANRIPIVLVTL
jgi:hypothetical protein